MFATGIKIYKGGKIFGRLLELIKYQPVRTTAMAENLCISLIPLVSADTFFQALKSLHPLGLAFFLHPISSFGLFPVVASSPIGQTVSIIVLPTLNLLARNNNEAFMFISNH